MCPKLQRMFAIFVIRVAVITLGLFVDRNPEYIQESTWGAKIDKLIQDGNELAEFIRDDSNSAVPYNGKLQ